MDTLPPTRVTTVPDPMAAPRACSRLRFDVGDLERIGVRDVTGAVSVVLDDGRVATLVVQSAEDARGMADARVKRGPLDLLVADCRPVAHAVADAIVAAGVGG